MSGLLTWKPNLVLAQTLEEHLGMMSLAKQKHFLMSGDRILSTKDLMVEVRSGTELGQEFYQKYIELLPDPVIRRVADKYACSMEEAREKISKTKKAFSLENVDAVEFLMETHVGTKPS